VNRRDFLIGSAITTQSAWVFGTTGFISRGSQTACVAVWDRMLTPEERGFLTSGGNPFYLHNGLRRYTPAMNVREKTDDEVEALVRKEWM
jgi:hypothetical protein